MPTRDQRLPLTFALVLALAIVALAAGPREARALDLQFVTTDADVDKAMERLTNYLWTRQRDDGSWENVIGSHYDRKVGGTTALATLALLEAGVKVGDPRMDKALKALMAADMHDSYCYSVRVMALSQAYRFAQRAEYETQIVKDLQWLTRNLPASGAWDYGGPNRTGDNSCSQYGLLALWEADWAGFGAGRKIAPAATSGKPTVSRTATSAARASTSASSSASAVFNVATEWPTVTRAIAASWKPIEKQWVDRQCADNGWIYTAVATPDVESTMTMTAAGVASLYILMDEVYAPKMDPGKPRPQTTVFEKADLGLQWLAKRLTPEYTQDGYLAFGIQRIGLASGRKYIGEHDWFREGVAEISSRVASPKSGYGGAYGNDVQAAFYLLFLTRGRVPVTFNKLERPGTDWDCAPRDMANLTRYLVTQLEQRMSWQIVGVDRPVSEFLDSPVLFINGIQPLKLSPETVGKMREYVLRGGLIVGEATTSSVQFADSFKTMLEDAFPEGKVAGAHSYVWTKMSPDHPVVQGLAAERDQKAVGPVWAMDDGTRTVAILLAHDQATAWQHMDMLKSWQSFTLGRNIFFYATAGEPLKTRLRPVFVGRQQKADVAKKIGLVHLGENWLSEDYAIERLSDKLAGQGRVMISSVQAVKAEEIEPRECPVVWVNVRGESTAPEALINSLKAYAGKGGTVVINAVMGDAKAGERARALAQMIVPEAVPAGIEEESPIFTGLVYRERGEPLTNPKFRQTLREDGVNKIKLIGSRLGERWAVIVSPYDTFLPLLGTPIWHCKGYASETALSMAANIYLYALEQAERGSEKPKS